MAKVDDDDKHPLDERDDPDAPPTDDELRHAAALRDELSASPERPLGPEAAWLLAHLRLPTWEDSLGDLRSRGLARGAREIVRGRQAAPRPGLPWRQLRRAVFGTGGLVAVAVALVVISSAVLDQAGGLSAPATGRGMSAALYRASIRSGESPSQRLDLMIEDRLAALRQRPRRGSLSALAGIGIGGGP